MENAVRYGKYTLHERLASGTLADIFRATTRTANGADLPVVIKKIRDDLAQDADFLKRFVDEARVASLLAHPNVARIFEWGRHEQGLFIAMEYIEGTNLAALMQAVAEQGIRFAPTTGIYIILETLDGLGYAHGLKDPYGNPMGLVHRGVCPQNIVVSSEGQVKLVDFGLAKVTSKLQETRPGLFEGKYGYMAPEVVRHQAVDARADLYSIGVVLYELLTGNKVQGTGPEAQISAVIRTVREQPPSAIHSDIPTELDQFLVRATSDQADQRPATASEMHAELDTFLKRWDRRVDPDALSSFILEVLSGRAGQKKENVGFAFGEATSQWMARGENLEELVKIPMAGGPADEAEPPLPGTPAADPAAGMEPPPAAQEASPPSPEGLLAEVPQAPQAPQAPAPAPAPAPDAVEEPHEPEFAPPKGRFSGGETVMAIKEGGLGKGRQLKNLLIVLAALAVVIAVVVLVVVNLKKEGGESAKKVEPAETESEKYAGAVKVVTEPDGAIVLIDGSPVEPVGSPPRIMGLRAGKHQVRLLVPGYLPLEEEIDFKADEPLTIERKLTERRGDLSIATKPAGAWLYVNGKRVGKTPRKLSDISAARNYKLVLKRRRFKTERMEIGPADWPENPDENLQIEKKLERKRRRRRRR